MRRGKTIATIAVLGAMAPTLAAHGGLISEIGPFVGDQTETWESFPNYVDTPGFFLADPTAIMGGQATISGSSMAVYEPGTSAEFSLGLNFAQVSDGDKGMGVSQAAATTIIEFMMPVFEFGAYWGSAMSNDVTVTFRDLGGAIIDSAVFSYDEQAQGGALEWHGWSSTTAAASVSYTGDFVVVDGLQANVAPVPGPASLALLALASVASTGRRRRS